MIRRPPSATLFPYTPLSRSPTAEGVDHVPTDGPAILASNHLSYADWLFMPLTLSRKVTFVAKAEYFTTPGFKGWLRSEEHTSELQSRQYLVCRLLLENKIMIPRPCDFLSHRLRQIGPPNALGFPPVPSLASLPLSSAGQRGCFM